MSIRIIERKDVTSTLVVAVDNAITPPVILLVYSEADCSLIKLHIPDPETSVFGSESNPPWNNSNTVYYALFNLADPFHEVISANFKFLKMRSNQT